MSPSGRALRNPIRHAALAALGTAALAAGLALPGQTLPGQTLTAGADLRSASVPAGFTAIADLLPRSSSTPVAPAGTGTTVQASSAGQPYVIFRTEAYGLDPLQWVTVSRLSSSIGRRPVVYFVHGGSWVMGNPSRWAHSAKVWAERGWTVVNVSYRLGVDGRLMLGDLRAVTEKYRDTPFSDPRRQILVGDSAGGQLVTLLAAKYPKRFQGVIAWSPVISPEAAIVTGTSPGATSEQALLAGRATKVWGFTHRTSTALSYVSAQTPPLWVAASTDEWLPYSAQGAILCAALGSRCTSTLVPGTAHATRLADNNPLLMDEALAWAESAVARGLPVNQRSTS